MKLALITGSSGGIGSVLVREFRTAGYQVIGLDREPVTDGDEWFVACDLNLFVIDAGYRQTTIEHIKTIQNGLPVSVIINNAAVQILGKTADYTPDQIQTTLNVNLIAPFLLVQSFQNDLSETGGSVINISSIHEQLTKPEFVWYATSKAALSGLTRSLAVDAGQSFRVNAICPAAIRTPMLEAGFEGREEAYRELAAMHPSNRIGEPEEVAALALFLASEKAGFINGSTIGINGGIGGRLHDPV